MVDFWTYLYNFRWGWVDAVKTAEASRDLAPLARLFCANTPMEQSTRGLPADLCDRHRLGRKPGRPPKPLFGPSMQNPFIDALRKAEKSRDLASLACLLRSNTPMEGSTLNELAKLFDRRQLIRKKGRPKSIFKFKMTAQDRYIEAANAVKRLRKTKRRWKEVEGAVALGHEGLIEQARSYFEGLEAITDPIDYVAQQLGLDAEMLESVLRHKIGFGRKAKPKSKPDM